jgi:hypothetical protein
MPKLLLFLLVLCCFNVANAQKLFTGRVLENKTRITLAGVRVENLTGKQVVVSDNTGQFSIKAKLGDLIVFRSFAYRKDTVYLADLHEREVFLEPEGNMLKEVTVTNQEINTKGWVDPTLTGKPVAYLRDEKGNFKGGIALRFGYGKGKQDKETELLQKEAAKDEVTGVFNAENIGKYVPLKGQELDNFIVMYTPPVKVFKSKSFNLLIYINNSYKEFMKLPAEKRQAAQSLY